MCCAKYFVLLVLFYVNASGNVEGLYDFESQHLSSSVSEDGYASVSAPTCVSQSPEDEDSPFQPMAGLTKHVCGALNFSNLQQASLQPSFSRQMSVVQSPHLFCHEFVDEEDCDDWASAASQEGFEDASSLCMKECDQAIQNVLQSASFREKDKLEHFMEALFGENGFCLKGSKSLLSKDTLVSKSIVSVSGLYVPWSLQKMQWRSCVQLLPPLSEQGKKHPLWSEWLTKAQRLLSQVSCCVDEIPWTQLSYMIEGVMIDRYGLELDVPEGSPLMFISDTKNVCDSRIKDDSLASYNKKGMELLSQISECKQQFRPKSMGGFASFFYNVFKKCVECLEIALVELKMHATEHCDAGEFNALISSFQTQRLALSYCEKCDFSGMGESFRTSWFSQKLKCDEEVAKFLEQAEQDGESSFELNLQKSLSFQALPQIVCSGHQSLLWTQCQTLLAARMVYASVFLNFRDAYAKNIFTESNICFLTSCLLIEREEIPYSTCSEVAWARECEVKIERLLGLIALESKQGALAFSRALFGEEGFCFSRSKNLLMCEDAFVHAKLLSQNQSSAESNKEPLSDIKKSVVDGLTAVTEKGKLPPQPQDPVCSEGKSVAWSEMKEGVVKALPALTEKGERHALWSAWIEKVRCFEEVLSLSGSCPDWGSLRNMIKDLMLDRYGLELVTYDGEVQGHFLSQTWKPQINLFENSGDTESQRDLDMLARIVECKNHYQMINGHRFGANYLFFVDRVINIKRVLSNFNAYVQVADFEEVNAFVKALEQGGESFESFQGSVSLGFYNKRMQELSAEVEHMCLSMREASGENSQAQSNAIFPSIPQVKESESKVLFWKQIKTLLAIRVFYNQIVPAIKGQKRLLMFSEGNVCAMAAAFLWEIGERSKKFERQGGKNSLVDIAKHKGAIRMPKFEDIACRRAYQSLTYKVPGFAYTPKPLAKKDVC